MCNDARCLTYTASTVPNSSVNAVTSLELDIADRPIISYFDTVTTALTVVKCVDTVCAQVPVPLALDKSMTTSLYNSLRLDSNGLPVVAYNDFGTKDLKIAFG